MINWQLRFKNKTTLISIVTLAVAIIYKILNLLDIIPDIEQQRIIDVLCMVIDLLAILGVVVDPTTEGIKDSNQALNYDEPKRDLIEDINNGR